MRMLFLVPGLSAIRLAGVCATLVLACLPAHAGRPLATDDASLTEHGACQLESWKQGNRGGSEFWVVPACNFSGNLELAFGGARLHDGVDGWSSAVVMQGKTLFRPLETNGWGVGLVFGNQYRPGGSLAGDLYAFVPASWSYQGDRVLLHANLGWLREREGRRDRATWGLGSEFQLGRRSGMSIETFGQDRGRPLWQAGARHWLVPDRVQLDASFGGRLGYAREERWFSIGLKLVSPPFLRRAR